LKTETYKRNIEIIKLFAEGYTAREIGEKLFMSERTVENNIQLMKQAWACKTIPHLVGTAYNMGLIIKKED
jgi:DNA-binding NarL/FixJ family response regulator